MTSVDSNFNFLCGRPHVAGPPSTCVHLSLTPAPLRVDVINGWPLIEMEVGFIHKNYASLTEIEARFVLEIAKFVWLCQDLWLLYN